MRTKGLLSWLPVVAIGGLLVAGVGGYRMMNGKCPLTGCDLCPDSAATATPVADEHGGCCPLSAGADATLVADHAEGECPLGATECTLSKECDEACEKACEKACDKAASECQKTCEEQTEQAQAESKDEKPAEPIGG